MEHRENDVQQQDPGAAGAPDRAPRHWLLRKATSTAAATAAAVVLVSAAVGAVGARELWSSSTTSATPISGFSSPGSIAGSPFPGYGGGSGSGLPYGGGFQGGSSGSSAIGGASVSSSVTAKVDPALVNIDTTLGYQSSGAAGTGVVLTSNGEVLTNNHVIAGATKITATDVGNGKTYAATVVGYDPSSDIAVIQLTGASGLKTADLGDSSKATVGEAVIGIGNAGGAGGTPSAAAGTITALNQSITAMDDLGSQAERLSGLLETNAGIQPGDSGGPLVNAGGEVLGIDTAGSQTFTFESVGTQAYAIPINTAVQIAKQIEAGHSSSTVHLGATAFLGISVAGTAASQGYGYGGFGNGAAASTSGVVVAAVVNGKPAAAAGITAGDTLTSLNGKTLTSRSTLSNLLLTLHPGDSVKLVWTDAAGQSHSASAKLATGPAA